MVTIGVLCPAEIAYRRFLPALKQIREVSFAGVGVNSYEERFGLKNRYSLSEMNVINSGIEKAKKIQAEYGGIIYNSFLEMINEKGIDAIYIPLPPALHFYWAKKALEAGKHVLVEKPATTLLSNTDCLINMANERGLALHENYMFLFHNQIKEINTIISEGKIGEIRLYKISFGFPKRDTADFRYNKSLGGGALLDAGGYTLKYASYLLGSTTTVRYAQLNYLSDFEVDVYGSGALTNDRGVTAQISFGMDNNYRCQLEVWGSTGTFHSGRVFTSPPGYEPTYEIEKNGTVSTGLLESDDAFKKSIIYFLTCISDREQRKINYERIRFQAMLVDEYMKKAFII